MDAKFFPTIPEDARGPPRSGKCGRPPFGAFPGFRMLGLRSLPGLSMEATGRLVRDGLGWQSCGLDLGLPGPVPDSNMLRERRNRCAGGAAKVPEPRGAGQCRAPGALFQRLDLAINAAGVILALRADHRRLPAVRTAMAMLVASPGQRNSNGGKAAVREGILAADIWPKTLSEAERKGFDARCTAKQNRAKPAVGGCARIDIAIPVFGCKSHVSVGRMQGIICRLATTDAAAHGGACLQDRTADAGREVRAGTRTGRRKTRGGGKPLAWPAGASPLAGEHADSGQIPAGERANGRKSRRRSHVAHVFSCQKDRMALAVRTIGLARAKAPVALAAMVRNKGRLCWPVGSGRHA
ncbi:hypothetical protein [Mangrovicoccus sp. HB161399]|uniref:hypothetical protein n=1 Tax=Mangrovicoccus sp. HB161399 TaxID=2720392 RepID=UPI001556D245|nr:hypothetical protein [Mangrovicoccus sp. HB161399]